MEECNGMDFITRMDPAFSPKIVVISGNDAYDFVRECFKLNVVDYLLKPVEYSELEKIMMKLCQTTQTEPETVSEYVWGFAAILKTGENGNDAIKRVLEIPKAYQLKDGVSVLTYDEMCDNSFFMFLLRDQKYYDACVEQFKATVFQLAKDSQRLYKAAFSSPVQISSFNKAVQEVQMLFKNRLYDTNSACYGPHDGHQMPISDDADFERDLRKLTPCLNNKDTELYQRFIDHWFRLDALRNLPYDMIKKRYEAFRNKMYREILPYNEKLQLMDFDRFNTLQEVTEHIQAAIFKIKDFLRKNRYEVDVMQQTLTFIDQNYQKDINLSLISNTFNLSYSYFSRVFKMYVGISFTQYLLKTRMEKAKELLLSEPDIKIKEVAYKVGYGKDNVQNFTRAFKNYFGKSPQHYKE